MPDEILYVSHLNMDLTTDQQIQVLNAVGTWVAGIGTLAAVVVALYLARRGEKLRLNAHAGLRDVVAGDGTPVETHLSIGVTNLGDRPVTINSVGWAIGKRKNLRMCVQPVSAKFTSDVPVELSHGKNANFMVSFKTMPNWPREFAREFVRDVSDKNLKTLVVLIGTSVGETIHVRPEGGLLYAIKRAHGDD